MPNDKPILYEADLNTVESEQFRREIPKSGHKVTLVSYASDPDSQEVEYYFKKDNKHGSTIFSILEVLFSELAFLYLPEKLTSELKLVLKGKEDAGNSQKDVVAIASRSLDHVLNINEDVTYNTLFQLLIGRLKVPIDVAQKKSEKRYIFLGDLPHSALSNLISFPEKLALLGYSIDYDSLAAVLGMSYFLQEDDLHRENIGFYVDGKKITFFKIDHDRMMYDAICSKQPGGMRANHTLNVGDSFNITVRDLLNFPIIKDAKLQYWPTEWRLMTTGEKSYKNKKERKAFRALAKNPEFQKAKWKIFLKCCLTSEFSDTLQQAMQRKVRKKDYYLANQVNNALAAQHSQFISVLFSIGEFREFLLKEENDFSELTGMIARQLQIEEDKVNQFLNGYKDHAQSINDKDSPLHVAIKLGHFRYDETLNMKACKGFLNSKNSEGKTPLALACEQNDLSMIEYLISKGAKIRLEIIKACCEREQADVLEILTHHQPKFKKIISNLAAYGSRTIIRSHGLFHKNVFVEWIDFKTNANQVMVPLNSVQYDESVDYDLSNSKTFKTLLLMPTDERPKINDLNFVFEQNKTRFSGKLNNNDFEFSFTGREILFILQRLDNQEFDFSTFAKNDEFQRHLLQIAKPEHFQLMKRIINPENAFGLFTTCITELGQRTDMSLRQKKDQAIHISKILAPMLSKANEFEGVNSFLQDNPEAKYLTQLNNQFWLLRKIRGTYGTTKTINTISEVFNKSLLKFNANCFVDKSDDCACFFSASAIAEKQKIVEPIRGKPQVMR